MNLAITIPLQEAMAGGILLIGLVLLVSLIAVPALSLLYYRWFTPKKAMSQTGKIAFVLLAVVLALLTTAGLLYLFFGVFFQNFSYS